MKIISALGGGGSSFVLRALDRLNYRAPFAKAGFSFDPYDFKCALEKFPALIHPYQRCLQTLNWYSPKTQVLIRPDRFWSDTHYHRKHLNYDPLIGGRFPPEYSNIQPCLVDHREHILHKRHYRSAGLGIVKANIATDSLAALVKSYLAELERLEKEQNLETILIAMHWGEFGIFKNLGVETIYIVRDPLNSLVSHAKEGRHKAEYVERGLGDINDREWIDNYLSGPRHNWINHAKSAFEHAKGIVVRYNHFGEDWKKIVGLPDISGIFRYSENPVEKILTKEARDYIHAQTDEWCQKLGL